MPAPLETEERRMRWRCRRGMKELDVLLERFARLHLPVATREQRRAFSRLLELPDPLLADYLFGYARPPEPEMAGVAALISAGLAR